MEPRKGSLKVNFREIARDLGISPMTLYRVVNNSPLVKRETRTCVIDALNRHGYYTHKPQKNIRVLFDFTSHEYLTYYGSKLRSNIARLNYRCFETDHRKNFRHFLDAATCSDVAVFISIPDNRTIDLAREENPDLYTITLSTKSNADVTLSPDNTRGGELAARHLHKHGHSHIAVHLSEKHPTRMERYKAFYAEMKLLDPSCRIDVITERKNQETRKVLLNYFNSVGRMPDSIFFLAGQFADICQREILDKFPERFKALGVMTFDNPLDLEYKKLQYDFDRIEFVSRELLDWAEYYITNRPMMKKRSPVHTSINVKLVSTGSIRTLKNTTTE